MMGDLYRDSDLRFVGDPEFRALVTSIERTARGLGFTAGEIKQAAFYAILRIEESRTGTIQSLGEAGEVIAENRVKDVPDELRTPATLASVTIYRPDAHPAWSTYLVSLVHLRDGENLPPARKRTPASTHEITIQALDPRRSNEIAPLTPPNLVEQLEALEDAEALGVWRKLVQLIAGGHLSPDTDFHGYQVRAIRQTAAEVVRARPPKM